MIGYILDYFIIKTIFSLVFVTTKCFVVDEGPGVQIS